MPRSLYDLLPPEVQQAHPAEALNPRARAILLRPGLVPDDADEKDVAEFGDLLSQRMSGLLKQDKGTQDWLAMRSLRGTGPASDKALAPAPAQWADRDRVAPALPEPSFADRDLPEYQRSLGVRVRGREANLQAERARVIVEASRNPLARAGHAFGESLPEVAGIGGGHADPLLPAQGPLEHAADVVGSVGGFGVTAGVLSPFVSPPVAAGIAAASQRGSLKERAIRGVANWAGAGLAGKASSAILNRGASAKAVALAEALGGAERPTLAREAASHLPGAALFGGGVSVAEAAMHRATGDKDYPMPGPKEWATGAGDMLVVGLVGMAAGRALTPEQQVALERAPKAVRDHATYIARMVAPPRGYTVPRAEANSLRESLQGKTVWLDVPGGLGRGAAKVRGVTVYRGPQGQMDITLLVSDPQGAVMAPVRFNSLDELVSSIGRLPRTSPDAVIPTSELAPTLPEGRAAAAQAIDERAQNRLSGQPAGTVDTPEAEFAANTAEGRAARSAKDVERLAEVESQLARLQKFPRKKGDKEHRRWAQRVEKLTAERDALRATGAKVPAPSPAPVVPDKPEPPPAPTSAPPPAEPPPTPAKPEAPAAEPVDPAANSRFKGNEYVRVPNYTNRTNDKRNTVTGRVIDHVTLRDSKGNEVPGVRVFVRRGQGGSTHEIPETDVKKMPTNETRRAAADKRKATQRKLRDGMAAKIGGDPEKARELIDHYHEQMGAVFEKYGDGVTDTKHPDYAKARRAWRAAHDAAEMAKDVLRDIEGEPLAGLAAAEERAAETRGSAPLEQTSLGGMPKPELPKGTKKGDSTGSAAALEGMAGEARTFAQHFADRIAEGDTPTEARAEAERLSGERAPKDFDAEQAAVVARRQNAEAAGQGDLSFDPDNLPEVNASRASGSAARGRRAATPVATKPTPRVKNIPQPQAALPIKNVDTLPGEAVPGGSLTADTHQTVLDRIGKAGDEFSRAMTEIVAGANALHLASKGAVDDILGVKGEVDKRTFRTHRDQKHTEDAFDRMDDEQVFKFLKDMEAGRTQADPRLEAVAKMHRERYDLIHRALREVKEGVPYWDNYVAHMWQKPEQAREVMSRSGTRQMEGTRSALKKRTVPNYEAGLLKGLKLVDRNPERILQKAERDVAEFVMAHELALSKESLLQKRGQLKAFPLGTKPGENGMPKNWVKPKGSWAQRFANPEQEVKEHYDKHMMDGMKAIMARIGARYTRKRNVGGGALGWSKAAPGTAGEIMVRNATPLSTVAHELGHAIDAKYGMKRYFLGRFQTLEKELRALADLRHEGISASQGFKDYVRKDSEKMAVMMEAWVHAPQRFKEVAPVAYDRFVKFMGAHADTRAVLDLKPSLVYEENTFKVHAGGPVLGQEIYGEPGVVRMLDNMFSRDPLRKTALGGSLMEIRNHLNSIQLGFSAFHATNIAYISAINRLGIGLSKVAHGQFSEGAGDILRAPKAALDYYKTGQEVYDVKGGNPQFKELEDLLFAGGAKLVRAEHEMSSIHKMMRYRLGSKSWLKAAGAHKTRAVLAAIEAPTAAIMHGVERAKIGAFREQLAWDLRRHAKDIANGDVTVETLARKALRDIDDRMGMMNYDNLFWNNTLKTAVMLLVRAPGWTLGTARAMGGTAFVDLPRFVKRSAELPFRMASGQHIPMDARPQFTNRMAFSLALVMGQIGVGGALTYMFTGKPPKDLVDYLHPYGSIGPDGKPARITLPTDVRTAEHWVKATGDVVARKPGAGAGIYRAVATGPLPVAVGEFINNQTYRGPLYKKDMTYYEHAESVLKWMFGTVTPISIQSAGKDKDMTKAQRAEQFMGLTPYHDAKDRKGTHKQRGKGM